MDATSESLRQRDGWPARLTGNFRLLVSLVAGLSRFAAESSQLPSDIPNDLCLLPVLKSSVRRSSSAFGARCYLYGENYWRERSFLL